MGTQGRATVKMDTFTKTLHTVLAGTRSLEEFAHVLVTSAVEDALLCVSRDYGYEYAVLLRKYRDDVVGRHTSRTLSEKTQCLGRTKGGKPCGKRAVLHGYCQQHAVEATRLEGGARMREAISDEIADPEVARALDLDILCGGHRPKPATAYCVPAFTV